MFKVDEYETSYLYPYYSIDYRYNRGIAIEIIDFKNNVEPAVDKIVNEFIIELKNLSFVNNSCIITVPSHDVNGWSESLINLAKIASSELGIVDYSCLLKRYKFHEKLSCGGDRSIKSHLDSICINPNVMGYNRGLEVILIDDVTTTGNSLFACEEILKKLGFQNIHKFAIAKTTEGSEFV